MEGGDVEEEEEEEEEKPALLGERFERKPLTQATIDIWEEEQMMAVILISSGVDGDDEAAKLAAAAAEDCEARDRQRLLRLLALSSRAE